MTSHFGRSKEACGVLPKGHQDHHPGQCSGRSYASLRTDMVVAETHVGLDSGLSEAETVEAVEGWFRVLSRP